MTEAEQFQAAMDELAALTSSDDVAAFLASQGITGLRREPACCPVANYVKKKCPAAKYVWALPWEVRWSADWSASYYDHGQSGRTNVPAPIRAFMARFDNGAFPGLEAPPA